MMQDQRQVSNRDLEVNSFNRVHHWEPHFAQNLNIGHYEKIGTQNNERRSNERVQQSRSKGKGRFDSRQSREAGLGNMKMLALQSGFEFLKKKTTSMKASLKSTGRRHLLKSGECSATANSKGSSVRNTQI